jgi:predicted nucleic acid-binding protein
VILVDTSVWISHLRAELPGLTALMEARSVVTHEFIIGELAAGGLPRRARTIADISVLPRLDRLAHNEVIAMVETERLFGLGLSWIDVHLLASVRKARARVWSRDLALVRAATAAGLAHPADGVGPL